MSLLAMRVMDSFCGSQKNSLFLDHFLVERPSSCVGKL